MDPDLDASSGRDGTVNVEELLTYLRSRVPEPTGNLQTPTPPPLGLPLGAREHGQGTRSRRPTTRHSPLREPVVHFLEGQRLLDLLFRHVQLRRQLAGARRPSQPLAQL